VCVGSVEPAGDDASEARDGTLDARLPRMLTIKTILVAVDFGDSSDAAFRHALTFARAFDATILVMHAVDVPIDAYPGYPLLPMGDISGAMEAAARKGLDAELLRAAAEWPKVKSVLRRGKPWREVIDVAVEEHADLIVMGTHGRQGIAHALLGSVAERVVRASPVPVMTIRAATSDASPIAAEKPKALDEVDRYEQQLARPSVATIEASTFSGAIAGMTAGALAGPLGAIAGTVPCAIVGGIIGYFGAAKIGAQVEQN